MMTTNYIRGTNDARRYSHVEQTEAGWTARRSDAAAPVWILEPVDQDYLHGLCDGGCNVRRRGEAASQSPMDRLLSRVAGLMAAA